MSADDYYLIRLHPDHSTYPPETNPRFIIVHGFMSSDTSPLVTDKLLASMDPSTDFFPTVEAAIRTINRHQTLGVGRYSTCTEYGIEIHPECFPEEAFDNGYPSSQQAYPLKPRAILSPEPTSLPASTFPPFLFSSLDEVVKYYSGELEQIYEKRTAGDFTFTGVLVEFYHAMATTSASLLPPPPSTPQPSSHSKEKQ